MYDERAFIKAMEGVGVRVLSREDTPEVGAGNAAEHRRVEVRLGKGVCLWRGRSAMQGASGRSATPTVVAGGQDA